MKENKDTIISEIEASDDNHRGNEKTTLKKEREDNHMEAGKGEQS